MAEILDLVVAVLLVVAIAYGFVLNKRIMLIQDSKKELANLFRSFDDTILKAQAGIDALKNSSVSASSELQKKIDKAVLLIDDISFLSDKAVQATKMLETANKKFGEGYSSEQGKQQAVVKSTTVQNKLPANIDRKPTNSEQQKRAKVLEGLLEKIAEGNANKETIKNTISSSQVVPSSRKIVQNTNKNSQEEQVATVLKALGYGEQI